MSRRERVWLITGASRGLGKALAMVVLAAGDTVIGTTRTGAAGWGDDEPRLTVIRLELTDVNSVQDAVVRAYALRGRLDVVLNTLAMGSWARSKRRRQRKRITCLRSTSWDHWHS